MKDPGSVLSVAAIILTLMGGVAGNFLVGITERFKKKRPVFDKNDIPDAILLISFTLFLLYVLGTMVSLLLFGNITTNPQAYFAVIGIILGIMGSILTNYLVIYWDRHHETRIKDGKWLNFDGWMIIILGILIAAYIGYFLLLLQQYI